MYKGQEISFKMKMSSQFFEAIAKQVVKEGGQSLLNEIAKQVTSISKTDNIENDYSVKEVAKLREVSEATIRKHIALGLLKAKKVGKSYNIKENDLKNYLNGK